MSINSNNYYESIYVLSRVNPNLAKAYDDIIIILSFITHAVMQEMILLDKDMHYWKLLMDSPRWYINLKKYNSRVYHTLRGIIYRTEKVQRDQEVIIENVDDNIINKIIQLRSTMKKLAILLKILYDIDDSLDKINQFIRLSIIPTVDLQHVQTTHRLSGSYYDPNASQQYSNATAAAAATLNGNGSGISGLSMTGSGQVYDFSVIELELHKTINMMYQIIVQFNGSTYSFMTDSINSSLMNTANSIFHQQHPQMIYEKYTFTIDDLISVYETKIGKNNLFDREYPLQTADLQTHRPNRHERYFIRNVILSIGATFAMKKLYSMVQDGSLQAIVLSTVDTIQQLFHEHVVEPCQDLIKELFETMQFDEIVSKRELDQSREALRRMLDDFSKSNQGLQLFELEQLKKTLNDVKDRAANVMSKTTTTVTDNLTDASSSSLTSEGLEAIKDATVLNIPPATEISSNFESAEKILRTDLYPDSSGTSNFSVQEAYEVLMRSYEAELAHPLKGIMFGNLSTAILIQMQKLKVHTEAAMLKMDKVLASNQLTMAGTAAMPGFLLIFSSYYLMKRWMTRRKRSIGDVTVTLRIGLNEVERCLLEIHSKYLSSSPAPQNDLGYLHNFANESMILPPQEIARGEHTKSPGLDLQKTSLVLNQSNYIQTDHLESIDMLDHDYNHISTPRRMNMSFSNFQSPPMMAANNINATTTTAAGQSIACVLPIDHRKNTIFRGMLHFYIHRLRSELYQYYNIPHIFSPSGVRINKFIDTEQRSSHHLELVDKKSENWIYSCASYVGFIFHGLVNIFSSPSTFFSHFIHDSDDSYWLSLSSGHVENANLKGLELSNILKDLNDLEKPEGVISGVRKLKIVSRMRSSYSCFVPKFQ